MTTLVPPGPSRDSLLVAGSAALNVAGTLIDGVLGAKTRPIARYVGRADIADPPAPAWYLPASNDIYIHVDEAKIKNVPRSIDWYQIHVATDADQARIIGLLSHEAAHAAISDLMTPIQMSAPHHFHLLSLLEELRVENYAVRRQARVRRFLRASFGLVLSNLPAEYTDKSQVVRAWAIARGRTLAGVAAADETNPVDLAARTLLGDDVVEGLTDLLQEALTLPLEQRWAQVRMVEVCDEWVALVGETAETPGCTTCARRAKPGEEPDAEATAGSAGDTEPDTDTEPEPGPSADAPTPTVVAEEPAADGDGIDAGTWGQAGANPPDTDPDAPAGDRLTDEAGELMSMLARDLADLMQEEWTRDLDTVDIANASEWAAKVFGNRRRSTRLTQSEPTGQMRQHVVQVAQALSHLSLPTITKTPKASEVPPGRLRSREALRASAERASGRMVTARPWKSTVRRHATARPLVIGIATDTSGSMRWAEDGVAEFAYVYTNAGHRIGARTAAVTFGSNVYRIARPGEVMTHVERKTAVDSHEEFDHAMAALDGVLHLTSPAYAARILLIISDGAFVKGRETARAAEWLRRMDKAGTHVLWIGDREVGTWQAKLSTKLDGLSIVSVEAGYRGRRRGGAAPQSVFDLLNGAALDAVKDIF